MPGGAKPNPPRHVGGYAGTMKYAALTIQRLREVRREEARFQQEGVVALVGVDGDPHHGHVGLLEQVDELGLLLRMEGHVRVDAEDEELLVPAAREELVEILAPGLGHQVEPLPGVDDAQVGVGVEALHELLALVEHVGLDRVVHLVPAVRRLVADHLAARPFAQGVERDEGLVRDAPRQRQADVRARAVVVIAALEMRVALDGA